MCDVKKRCDGTMRCHLMRQGAIRQDLMCCDVVLCGVMRYNTVMRGDVVGCDRMWSDGVGYDAMRFCHILSCPQHLLRLNEYARLELRGELPEISSDDVTESDDDIPMPSPTRIDYVRS
jgi:hypothetical protein